MSPEVLADGMADACISVLFPLVTSAASTVAWMSVLEHCIRSHGVRVAAGVAGVS